ncbi:hypothetical protein OO012_12560 [Rhodobacteraceae bacterium KMM 6894]|nr:hypothetical protein [Rhodobacteraceae bacterium KMM 6894]
MTTKFLTAAFVLALTPGFAFAMGCSHGNHDQAMSCAAGSTYDTATATCVPVASS